MQLQRERKSITCTTSISTTRGLIVPKMFIPDLLNDTGRRTATAAPTQCEGAAHFGRRQLLASMRPSPPGRASPMRNTRSSGTPATTPAPTSTSKKLEQSLVRSEGGMGKRRRNTAEKTDAGWRFVTHEGMSNTVVTLFDAPDGTCYDGHRSHWTLRRQHGRESVGLEPRPRR